MIAHYAEIAWALTAVALVLAAIWGIGGAFQNWLREGGDLLDSEYAVLRFLMGAGSLGLVTFLAGQIHFSVWSNLAILSGAALLNLRFPWSGRRWISVTPSLLFAGVVVLFCGISGLARPVGDVDADEISYHLLGPPIWLREQRIAPVLEEALTSFPATIEMLYGTASVISNASAPGALGSLFFGALVLQVRGLARRLGGGVLGGDLAAAFIAGMPAVTSTVDQCFVDVPYAAFIMAAARLALDRSSPRRAMLAGAFAGFAAGTKYFGLPAALMIASFILVFQEGKAMLRARTAMIFLLTSGIAGGAWYVRNWLVLGNPLYPPPPMLWHLLPTPTFPFDACVALKARITLRGAGLGKGFADLLLLPFRLTYWTAWFHGGGGMGLAPLAFGPVALALVWKKRMGLAWACLGALLTVFWFYSDQEFRFLDPAVAIFAAFAGVGAEALLHERGKLYRWPAYAAIAISLAIGGLHAFSSRVSRLLAVLSPTHAEQRFREGVPHREAFAYLNSRPEVKKVFFCHPYTTVYYLHKPYTVAIGRLGEQPHAGIRSVADAIGAIRDLGVTHVFDLNFYNSGFAWPTEGAGRLVHEEKDVRIYSCDEKNTR
ncbi:MAG: hypothetical protein ABIZ56_02845 [Chthoniobacteraceae bacterium]